MLSTLAQDLRYSARLLAHAPGFTAAAALTLALGIGANTAIFSVLHGVVLSQLPYRDSDRLTIIWNDFGEHGQSLPATSALDFLDYQEQAQLFEGFAAAGGAPPSVNLTSDGEPEPVVIRGATANLFSLLGVEPLLGRSFLPEETVFNAPPVVILDHGLWKRKFGSDPLIVGKTIEINGVASTVVGVLPADFELIQPPEAFGPSNVDLWGPTQFNLASPPPRNLTGLTVYARLGPGVTIGAAQAEMDAIASRLRAEHLVHERADLRVRVVPLHRDVVKHVAPILFALLGAVGLVLMIACANVASLLLSRASARGKEMAVRLALGASRTRIVRQMLTETLLLSALGGVIGLLLASWGLDLLLALQPADLPRLDNVGLHGVVLLFAGVACLSTAVISGLLPALQSARADVQDALREGGRTADVGGQRFRNMLVVTEVAFSLILLIGAGLLLRTFASLQRVEPGFVAEEVLTFGLFLPPTRYSGRDASTEFFRQVQEKIAALPGVESVGAISNLPLSGAGAVIPYAYDELTEQNWESVSADSRNISPSYFPTVEARLLAGRLPDERDTSESPLVLVVDDTLARSAWPGQNPIGKSLKVAVFQNGGPSNFSLTQEWGEVIGMVDHLRIHSLSEEVRGQIYFSYAQQNFNQMSLVVRSPVEASSLVKAIRGELRALDAKIPMARIRPMEAYLSDSLARARFSVTLAGIFSVVAVVLTLVGLFGVVSYSVSQRSHEFGVRLALGAQRRDIVSLVVSRGVLVALAGVGLGLAGAFLLTGFLESQLFGVEPTDPATFAGYSALLVSVAALACYLPARRAARVDPIHALRAE